MTFDLAAFRATKRACDDATWAEIQDDIGSAIPQSAVLLYADGYAIHELEGRFFVHAWWYSPIAYDTLEEAEMKLHPWYLEWQP